jgi:hypothetical protein
MSGEVFQYSHWLVVDMNDFVTTLDTITARSDDPVINTKISTHFGGPGLNVDDPNTHFIKNQGKARPGTNIS